MAKVRLANSYLFIVTLLILVWLMGDYSASAQTTAFTYQGKLTDAGNPANGNYDLQFKLFDALAAGTQLGGTLVRTPVTVSAGIFSVTLDFGANVFSGADRYLEIGVRPAGSAVAYTILLPRQAITSSPYAIQTLNAAQLGGVEASRYIKADTSGNVGIGIANALAKMHIMSSTNDLPPRLQSSGTTGAAAGWDFFHGTTAKGYVGVPDASATQAAGEMTLFGGTGVKTSLWAGGARRMTLHTNGNVGIGTAEPTSKLEIAAQDGLAITGFNPFLTLRDTANNGRKSYIQGVNGDLIFIPQSFSPGGAALVIKDNSGNVGIGVGNPLAKLQVATGNQPGIHATSQGNAILGYSTSPNYAAIHGENLTSGGIGVYGASTNGYAMFASGHTAQTLDKGGWVKAMLLVNADGSINLCYNSYLTGSAATTPPCGFNIGHPQQGRYEITFPFQVNSRFFSATVSASGIPISVKPFAAQAVRVEIASAGFYDFPFYLIVF